MKENNQFKKQKANQNKKQLQQEQNNIQNNIGIKANIKNKNQDQGQQQSPVKLKYAKNINQQYFKQQTARLEKFSKQQLINQVFKLTTQNKRLSNRLSQFQPQKQKQLRNPNQNKINNLFQQFQTKKYALKISYIGLSYDGMAVQADTQNTIQSYLFKVLHTLSLTKQPMPGQGYTRAGRTDKGVSAMGNVVSLPLRTSIRKKQAKIQTKQQQKNQKQYKRNQKQQKIIEQKRQNINNLNYCSMINALLPEDIRILACSQVAQEFNSRYHCTQRSYKYFFAKNNLNIQIMREAIKLFIGTHNFVNYCKMNLSNTVNFERTIMNAQIRKADNNQIFQQKDNRNQIYYFYYIGNSFLWHQIRFMSSILFLVGSGQQKPEIVSDLLDIEKYPKKPNYSMAPEYSLILEDCLYDTVKFQPDQQTTHSFYNTFYDMVMRKSVQKTLLINCMMMARRQFLNNMKLAESVFIQQSKKKCQKVLTKKKKPLAIHKSSGRGVQQAIKNLKGKKLDLYQKKAQKQAQYEQKKRKQRQAQQQQLQQAQKYQMQQQ